MIERAPGRLGVVVLSGLLGASACGSAPGPRKGGVEAQARPGERASEARWIFHPTVAARVTAALDLGEGKRLEVDAAGSRWLLEGGRAPQPSAFGAPEPLVAAFVEEPWLAVVGRSGGVYLTSSPLGPFTQARLPKTPHVTTALSHVPGAGYVLLAVGRRGELLRSEDRGQSWQKLDTPGFFSDVAWSPGGQALALSLPESWFVSEDRGRSFRSLDVESIAPTPLRARPSGPLVVDGLLGSYEWQGAGFVPTQRLEEPPLVRELPRFAHAADLASGRMAWSGGRVWGFDGDPGRASLGAAWSGAWDEPLVAQKTLEFAACGTRRVAAAGSFVHVVCEEPGNRDVAPRLWLWTSADRGLHFQARAVLLRGTGAKLTLAAHASGALALSGICPAASVEAGCQARGAHLLLHASTTPRPLPFVDLDRSVALAFDEERLMALGRRPKDGHAVFQKTEPLDLSASSKARGSWGVGVQLLDLDRLAQLPTERSSEGMSLWADPGGATSIVLRVRGQWFVFLVDREGRALSVAQAPAGSDAVSGSGARLVALDAKNDVLWETATAGLEWQRADLPRALCGGPGDCKPALHCAAQGCLLGEELSRVGWGTGAAGQVPVASEAGAGRALPERKRAVVHCSLDGGDWQDVSDLQAVPGASDAALGDVAFAQVESQPDQGSASAVHARWGSPALERHELFARLIDPERYAFAVSEQIEGSAVVRYRLPARGQVQPAYTNVEVAWDNRISGVLGRGALPGEFRPHPGDVESRSERTSRAHPGLISVAGRGLFLRLHQAAGVRQNTYFFEDDKVRTVQEASWPEALRGSEHEMVRVGARDVPLLWYQGGRIVVRALQPAGPSAFVPFLLSPLHAEERGLAQVQGIAYTGQDVGLLSILADPEGTFWSASVVPLGQGRAFDRPVRVPLQADLPAEPRSCELLERRETPRVVAPAFPGEPRVLELEEPLGGTISLRTKHAVLHGTPEQPCVAVYEAEQSDAALERAVRYRALWFPGPGQLSWIFREARGSGQRQLSARPLRCAE